MGFRKATPGEGMGAAAEQFAYVSPPAGLKTWFGWMAGDVYWCKAHEHTKTQPGTKVCCDWFSRGAVPCPRCRPAAKLSTIAYLPIYREMDHKPVLVICHESVSDLLLGLEYGVQVMVGRVDKGDSAFVRACEFQDPFKTENALRKKPCDLALTLFTLWNYPALTQWYLADEKRGNKGGEKVDFSAVPTESTGSVPLASNRLAEAFDHQAEAAREREAAAKKNADFVRQLASGVSRNGKHKPSGSE